MDGFAVALAVRIGGAAAEDCCFISPIWILHASNEEEAEAKAHEHLTERTAAMYGPEAQDKVSVLSYSAQLITTDDLRELYERSLDEDLSR